MYIYIYIYIYIYTHTHTYTYTCGNWARGSGGSHAAMDTADRSSDETTTSTTVVPSFVEVADAEAGNMFKTLMKDMIAGIDSRDSAKLESLLGCAPVAEFTQKSLAMQEAAITTTCENIDEMREKWLQTIDEKHGNQQRKIAGEATCEIESAACSSRGRLQCPWQRGRILARSTR